MCVLKMQAKICRMGQWYDCKAADWYGRGEATKCTIHGEYNRSAKFLVIVPQATGSVPHLEEMRLFK